MIKECVLVEMKELQRLVADSIEMDALRAFGVDNWSGYGANFREILEDYGVTEEDGDFSQAADNYIDDISYGIMEVDDPSDLGEEAYQLHLDIYG